MNLIRHIRRMRRFTVGAALLMLAGAPAALAMRLPPPGGPAGSSLPPQMRTVTHTVVVGGTPGWQTALIAVGAALLAATLAVLADRTRAARRPAAVTSSRVL